MWKAKSKLSEGEFTPRQRRKVSKYTLILSVFIYQVNSIHLISFYFILLRVIVQEEDKTESSLENIYSRVCKY